MTTKLEKAEKFCKNNQSVLVALDFEFKSQLNDGIEDYKKYHLGDKYMKSCLLRAVKNYYEDYMPSFAYSILSEYGSETATEFSVSEPLYNGPMPTEFDETDIFKAWKKHMKTDNQKMISDLKAKIKALN